MDEEVNKASEQLDHIAEQRHLNGNFHATYVRSEGNWLHFAVRLTNVGDSADRAKILQEIEDEWDAQKPRPHKRLLLIPTSS